MAYTNIDDPSAFFQAKLYTGNGGTLSVTNDGNSDLQPDWVWIKNRAAYQHQVYDTSRGVHKKLMTSVTNAESTDTTALTAFNTDGFSTGANVGVNQNNVAHVAWQWKCNGGTTASNSDGSITSTVQVNQDAGFSIITYTGNATNSTVGHGLGVQPSLIINKKRNATASWSVWNSALLGTQLLELNTSGAAATVAAIWNSTVPTSSVFSIGTDGQTNSNNATYVTYAFAEKQGYSKFGKYVGNANAHGAFVYTGFKPAFVMVKEITNAGTDWAIMDSVRTPTNANGTYEWLWGNLTGAEFTDGDAGINIEMDFLSNGFKIRTSRNELNRSGSTYSYMAFAENPFTTSTGVPTTAR